MSARWRTGDAAAVAAARRAVAALTPDARTRLMLLVARALRRWPAW